MEQEDSLRLTGFSKAGGCSCKIPPNVLKEILGGEISTAPQELLVGYNTNDDAAVYDLGDGSGLIATTDFFTPVVDDAFNFGRIAAANAISDVYAMGGTPLLALAILGWPVEKLPAAMAGEVLRGAREMCLEAGIPLAGGHSINSAEPIFGLSVNGKVLKQHLKRNNTARPGDLIYATKPIGTGILSAALKRGLLAEKHLKDFVEHLSTLNKVGESLAKIAGVSAMTDITGFGLLGHIIEMAEGAGCSAELYYSKMPVIAAAKGYLQQRIVPDATYRNWNSYSSKTSFDKGVDVMEAFNLLPDPQTNGGIMFTCHPNDITEVEQVLRNHNIVYTTPLGKMKAPEEKVVTVLN